MIKTEKRTLSKNPIICLLTTLILSAISQQNYTDINNNLFISNNKLK